MNSIADPASAKGDAPGGGSILIVEDEPTDRETVRRFLPRDFLLDEARTAREGRDFIEKSSYRCVLLDLGLPDADGLEQIAVFNSAAPVVVLTGQGDQRAVVEAMKRGAADYLVKDVLDRAGLARAIDSAIEKRRLELLIEEQNKRLLQDERLKVLMQLAGSTLHEIFEPLTQLGLYLEVLTRSTSLTEHEAEVLQGGYKAYADISATMRRVQLMHLEDGADATSGSQDMADVASEAPSVLLAGEEPDGFDGFRSLLADAGVAVESTQFRRSTTVSSLRSALDEWVPALIIMTVNIGEGSARDVVREARSREETVPVLAMLPQNAGAMAAELLRDGATEYLLEPDWTPGAVVESIRRCLERAAMSRELRESRERLHRMAFTDELTGLYNRRFLMETLEREIDRAVRQARPGAFCLMDIDFFKRVNDEHGHLVGDDVLRATAELVRNAIRKTDLAARYGGEEFAIILSDAGGDDAREVIEGIRKKIEAEIVHSQGIELSVTASFGVAFYGNDKRPLTDIISEADQALYQAKESGRNRVCISAPADAGLARER